MASSSSEGFNTPSSASSFNVKQEPSTSTATPFYWESKRKKQKTADKSFKITSAKAAPTKPNLQKPVYRNLKRLTLLHDGERVPKGVKEEDMARLQNTDFKDVNLNPTKPGRTVRDEFEKVLLTSGMKDEFKDKRKFYIFQVDSKTLKATGRCHYNFPIDSLSIQDLFKHHLVVMPKIPPEEEEEFEFPTIYLDSSSDKSNRSECNHDINVYDNLTDVKSSIYRPG